MFFGRTDVEAETPTLWPPDVKSWLIWKDPDAGKDWEGEGDNRGWGGWMASPTQWMWVWVDSGSWWWTGRPGVLRFMVSKELDTTEWLNWAEHSVTSWWPLLKCHSTPLPCFLFSHSNYCFLMLIYLFLCLLPWPEYQLQRVWFTVLSQCFKEGLTWRRLTNHWFEQILHHNVCGG